MKVLNLQHIKVGLFSIQFWIYHN